jgi:hypothetical protein
MKGRRDLTVWPVGHMATRRLAECIGGGASKGNLARSVMQLSLVLLPSASRWEANTSSPQTVQPSGAEPHEAHPPRLWVAMAKWGTFGAADEAAASRASMLTVPHAGELKCRGPVHKTESKEMTPAQATSVDAHSELTRFGNCSPQRAYHASGSSARAAVKAF